MSIEAAIDSVAHYCKKGEFDAASAVLEKDIIAKNARAWGSIIASYKGDVQRQTLMLAFIGGLRTQQLNEEGAVAQVVELFELIIEKGTISQLTGRTSAQNGLRKLMFTYVSIMRRQRQYNRAIRLLKKAVTLFQPEADFLTPMHAPILQLFLLSHNPSAAAALMDIPIFEIDPVNTGVRAVDFCAYFYYGGVAYTALGAYAKARQAFRTVLSVPAQALSLPMVLAFKCLTLINAITEPKPLILPPNFESRLERNLRVLARPYLDLVAALETRDEAATARVLEQDRQMFADDDLVGLVNQAVAAAPRQAILQLTKVYVTLTLQQIADEAQMAVRDVETTIASMISRGDLDATIDRQAKSVVFGQGVVPNVDDIHRDLQRVNELNSKIRDIDDRTIVSKPHVMAKLRQAPNLREILADYEKKRKESRGLTEALGDALRGLGA